MCFIVLSVTPKFKDMDPELAAIVSVRKDAYDRCDVALDHGRMPSWSPNSDYLDYWMVVYRNQTTLLADFRAAQAQRVNQARLKNEP